MFNFQALSTQQPANTTTLLEMPSLANSLWTIEIDSRIYQAISISGVLLIIVFLYMVCVEMHKDFKEKGLLPKKKDVTASLILIILTFNNARDINNSMLTTKNTMSIVKAPLNKVVDKNDPQSATDPRIKSYIKRVLNSYLIDF